MFINIGVSVKEDARLYFSFSPIIYIYTFVVNCTIVDFVINFV